MELAGGRGVRLQRGSRTGSHLLGMSLSTSQCYMAPCHPVLLGSLALDTTQHFLGHWSCRGRPLKALTQLCALQGVQVLGSQAGGCPQRGGHSPDFSQPALSL